MKDKLAEYGLQPQRIEVLDSSMVNDFLRCPSYFYFRHVLGLRKKHTRLEDDAPLDWGTLWHAMMRAYGNDGVDAALAVIAKDWPPSLVGETDRHGRSQERLAKIFFDYIEQFGEEDKNSFEIIRDEQHFDVLDPDIPLRWSGRIDRVIRRFHNGKIIPWDFKTTSWLTQHYFEKFEHSIQFPGYVWAANHLYPDEEITDIVIDTIHTLKNKHDFYRRTFRYVPTSMREWESNTKGIIDQIMYLQDNHLYNPNAWTRNWNACTDFNKLCMFADVHYRAPEGDTRLRILENDYFIERWDPRNAD